MEKSTHAHIRTTATLIEMNPKSKGLYLFTLKTRLMKGAKHKTNVCASLHTNRTSTKASRCSECNFIFLCQYINEKLRSILHPVSRAPSYLIQFGFGFGFRFVSLIQNEFKSYINVCAAIHRMCSVWCVYVAAQSKMHTYLMCLLSARAYSRAKNSVSHSLLNHHCYADVNRFFFLCTFTLIAVERMDIERNEAAENIQIIINLQRDI